MMIFGIFQIHLLLSIVLVTASYGDHVNDNSIVPATIPSQQLGTCAIGEQREQARQLLQRKAMDIIRDSVLPTFCNPGGHLDFPAQSCSDIPQECSSGWYWLVTPSEEIIKIYCDLERKCGCSSNNDQEAWMPIAHLDMTDRNEHCPEGLRTIENPKRSCRRSYQAFQTSIVPYRTYGFNYSHVCGLSLIHI